MVEIIKNIMIAIWANLLTEMLKKKFK